MDFLQLKKNLKRDLSHLKLIKVAILGDTATQLLTQAIKGYGFEAGINFDIFEADYSQIAGHVFDSSSDLYQFKPEWVIIFYSTQKLLNSFYLLGHQEKSSFADKQVENIKNIYSVITAQLPCKVIFFNFTEIAESVYGNYANKLDISFTYQLRKLNLALMQASRDLKNLFISDVSALQNQFGTGFVFDPKMYVHANMVFSLDVLPYIAKNTVNIFQAAAGDINKCLIMDLDNTLWGGLIGDDGIENIEIGDLGIGKVFTELQLWVKQLQQRGIILAICSKNDEQIAKEPFEKHPEMVLRLDDIAVFVANWDNKVDNIQYIQQVLNIGFDSMVFLDDSPFEREMIRTQIPEITVPELPKDPAEYLIFLRHLNLFETASYSENDYKRTKQYQEESTRQNIQRIFTDENDFLASLGMVSSVKAFDQFTVPRVAQLTQRSNQFNLRTIRYTNEDIQRIASSDNYLTASFTLEDKYGDYGLVSVVILKKLDKALFIDTWIMSCRVLKRSMENFVLNTIVELSEQAGFKKIIGEYIPTAKNGLVKSHYDNLGFQHENNLWILNTNDYVEKTTFINAKLSAHNTD